ncbi:MAG: hypothetical protein ACYTDV_20130 [Planctomycetota bacterium]
MEPEQDVEQQETPDPGMQCGWLLSWLLDNEISMFDYVLHAALISFVPSVVITLALAASGIMTEQSAPVFEGSPLFLLLMIVLIGPPIETLMMVPILWILSFLTKRTVPLAAMSALVWAALHSLLAPAWGLGVIWPFFVFSCAYLTWRKRSFWRAILVTSCVHSLQNLLPGIIAVAAQ